MVQYYNLADTWSVTHTIYSKYLLCYLIKNMNRLYSLAFILCIVMLSSCIKEESQFTIPFAPVRFEVDINGVDSDLYPFSYKVFTKPRANNEYVGYGGLLIFRSHDDQIFAFDLCCPHEDNKSILVSPLDDGSAQCDKCGSIFEIMLGSGIKKSGPSVENMQRYRVSKASRPGVFLVINL